ncbi:antitoxin AF2212-like protein [Thermococcus sp. JCM 11816]|uniref:antitoxin family protein n=1 Tax=Thermococcus sp. (strain JCM 11816 / KS-1) TaxID=1295125 RepID=UPI0006D0F091
MGTVIEAVYDGEKFRPPLKKVNLPPKGAKVKVIVGETIWDLMESVEGIPVNTDIEEVLDDVRGRKRVRY